MAYFVNIVAFAPKQHPYDCGSQTKIAFAGNALWAD